MIPRLVLGALIVAAAASVAGQSHVVYRDSTAETLFKTSRNAVGGEGTVSGIESLLLRGTATVAENDGGPAQREVEVRILLPDAMLRIDAASGYEKRGGLHGGDLLTAIRSGEGVETPPQQVRGQLLKAERARLGRLMLGIAAVPVRPGWLTLRSVRSSVTTVDPRDSAETALTAERGGQRVLEGSAADGFFVRLFFDGATLPARVQYEPGRGQQVVMEFSDRRRVSGLLLPYHIVTTSGGRIVDDFVIREIVVNPKFTAGDFEK
jgi:hypothetical protein